jgi:hypothetical protein
MKGKTAIKTGHAEFDSFYPKIKSFLEQDALDIVIDGQKIRGYRTPDTKSIWIRDYSDMLRGVKYFEKDLKSTVEHFAATQAESGRIFDYFTTFPEKLPCEKENWSKYVRVPVEADVEFRFVKAAYLAWQATGDDDWIKRLLPRMDRALRYAITHPWRWDSQRNLVKRAYTIDTWDFAYTAGKHDWLQFQIDENTYWGIMHGDNSGYFEAFLNLASLYDYFGKPDLAGSSRRRADSLKESMNRVCWNGRFYTHFVKITPVDIPGVDEDSQLSLSNPMDINRGAASHEMAVSIIREYMARRDRAEAFAEWFSIDPPFPDGIFGDDKLMKGAYVNGGIMPLVGGELARAAFDHGFEEYGVDILRRYFEIIDRTGESYLWYFPDGSPSSAETSTSPEATPSDGWGSSVMLYALIEGLAGIEDRYKLFHKCRLSPRWAAAAISEAEVSIAYEASGAGIGYLYRILDDRLRVEVDCEKSDLDFHILLPETRSARSITVNGKETEFRPCLIENKDYVDFGLKAVRNTSVDILFS